MQYRDYYEILGVKKDASHDEIKKTFRKLAKKHHPDANPGNKASEEKFKSFSEAYEVLGDESKRKKYDDLAKQTNYHNGSDFDPANTGSYNSGFNRRTTTTSSQNDFSDFFNAFFGGNSSSSNDDLFGYTSRGKTRQRSYAQDGENLDVEIHITVKEAFNGDEKKVTITGGTKDKTISFVIPAGIKSGEKIRLQGQGEAGINGGKNGDILMRVAFVENDFYKVNGIDLESALDILPWDAALGSEVPVHTIDGKIIVKIPQGIQTDSKIRVAGKGYKDTHGNRGDYFLKIRIVNPRNLSDDVKEEYQKLKKVFEK